MRFRFPKGTEGAVPLALVVLLGLAGPGDTAAAPNQGNDRTVLLGDFAPHKTKKDPAAAALIRQVLARHLAAQDFTVVSAPAAAPRTNLDLARTRGAALYLSGYYRRGRYGNLQIFVQIYDPDKGHMIDALNSAAEFAVPEELQLDPDEMKTDDRQVIEPFARKVVFRVKSNPGRRVRRRNIDEAVAYSDLGKSQDFPLPGAGSGQARAEAFQIIGEQEVSIASRRIGKGRTAAQASAIVTLFTRRDIERIGARNLTDVLKLVPGVETFYDQFGFYKASFRGIRSKSGVLLMIDGHRINNFYDGSTFLDIRADAIERVEIIRGPGSSIHGANAFVGVINVITREMAADKNQALAISGRGGSFQTAEPGAFYGVRSGDWVFSGYGHHYETEGQKFRIRYDETCTQEAWEDEFERVLSGNNCNNTLLPLPLAPYVETNDSKRQNNAFLNVSHKDDFYIKGKFIGERRGPHVGELTEVTPDSLLTFEHSFWDTGVRRAALSDIFFFSGRLYGDEYRKLDRIQVERPDDLDHLGVSAEKEIGYNYDTVGGELAFQWDLFRNNSLVFGLQVERQGVRNFSIKQNFETLDLTELKPVLFDFDNLPKRQNQRRTVTSTFVEDNWDFAPYWSLTLGVRTDEYSDFGEAVSPKAGIVWGPYPTRRFGVFSIKALYGEAFRAPTFQELYDQTQQFQDVGVFGNPRLQPETIQTYEAGITWQTPWEPLRFAWNGFSNRIFNNIEGINTSGTFPGDDDQYQNLRGIRVYGYETEGRLTFTEEDFFFINYSWFVSQDLGGFEDFYLDEPEEYRELRERHPDLVGRYPYLPDRDVKTDRLDVPQYRVNLGFHTRLFDRVDLYNAALVSSERWANFRFPFEAQEQRRFRLPRYALWNISLATTDRVVENLTFRLSVFNALDFETFDDANVPETAFDNRSIPTQRRYIEMKLTYTIL